MITRLLRFWLTFEEPVGRSTYLRHGLALVALKYAGDAGLIWLGTGRWWTPLDYLHSAPFHVSSTFAATPPFLLPALALWTLPFLWAGVTLTMRRALDAGWSAWLCVLFFVPFANWVLMLLLSTLPRAVHPRYAPPPRRDERRLPGALLAIAAGLALGLGMLALSVRLMQTYGLALFLGTPFLIGTLTAFLFNQRYPASRRETFEVAAMTLAIVAGAGFLLGQEGAVCLLMALPLGLVLGIMGAALGRALALGAGGSLPQAAAAIAILPSLAALDRNGPSAVIHEVRSSVEVAAPANRVWRHVIAFPPLPEPAEWIFRLGVAYPRSARIEGAGVGATRYCVFSTGPFVEPITTWEPGRRLAFDVSRSPAPLRELSPYPAVTPPHLDGYLRPHRGEFRLVPLPGGRTRLEGSTWYEVRMQPEGYWQVFSDALIARIHRRVLEHVRRQAEAADSTGVDQ